MSALYPDNPKITMEMFDEPSCERPLMALTYDLNQECFGWTRTVDENTAVGLQPGETMRDNSAACFQCFQGALCFREFTYVLTCEQPDAQGVKACQSTPKFFLDGMFLEESRDETSSCIADAANAYTRLVDGSTKNCPAWLPTPEAPVFDKAACVDLLEEKCTNHPAVDGHTCPWHTNESTMQQ